MSAAHLYAGYASKYGSELSSILAGDPGMYPLGMMGFVVWDLNSTNIGQFIIKTLHCTILQASAISPYCSASSRQLGHPDAPSAREQTGV